MPQSGRIILTSALATLVWLSACTSRTRAGDTLRTVALAGKPVSAADPTIIADLLTRIAPLLNNNGLTAFEAILQEPSRKLAAILTEGGGASLRIAANEQIPMTDGFPFPISLQALNDAGKSAYTQVVSHTLASQNLAIFRDNGPGDTIEIARANWSFETAYEFFTLFSNATPPWANGVSLTDVGQAVFPAQAFDSAFGGVRTGVWREDTLGELNAVVRNGDPAPGTASTFQKFNNPPAVVTNRNGRIAFWARLPNRQGIWSEHGNELRLDALTDDPAPGIDGACFANLNPVIGWNSAGDLSFSAQIVGNDEIGLPNFSLWRTRANGLELAVRTGNQAAGAAAGQVYLNFNAQVLNALGDMAFIATTGGPDGINIVGLWSDAGGHGFEPLAYRGLPAPGAEPGVSFESPLYMFAGSVGTPLILNAHGQVAFVGLLQGPGIDDSNNSGIWAQDRAGVLRLIARRGDEINVSDDPLHSDWRTISGLFVNGYSGNDDGRRSWFNDQGQLAFLASFTDGSRGIFVSNLATVPEPSTLFSATTAALGALLHRRRAGRCFS